MSLNWPFVGARALAARIPWHVPVDLARFFVHQRALLPCFILWMLLTFVRLAGIFSVKMLIFAQQRLSTAVAIPAISALLGRL